MILLILALQFFFSLCYAQEKEILIIGVMHQVPDIVRNSYAPLLKKAVKYSPEMIFVESPSSTDDISWEYLKNGWSAEYKKFYEMSDSVRTTVSDIDTGRLNALMAGNLADFTEDDIGFAMNCFLYLRDHANYEYYNYLKRYGLEGHKKPAGNEDFDLTYRLAIKMDATRLYGVDAQQTHREYSAAWQEHLNQGAKNGNLELLKKLDKKIYRRSIVPSVFGRFGIYTNSPGNLEMVHKFNSARYAPEPCTTCEKVAYYWDMRNRRIAENIISAISESPYHRAIVIIGAGHVIGLEKELKHLAPEVKVKLLN